MPTVRLTSSLQAQYGELYSSCEVNESRFGQVDAVVDSLLVNRARYEQVGDDTGAPWYLVAAIHNMESSQRFDRHLHNGDRLTARTRHVPAGRPPDGEPPFTWEHSARDALTMHKIDDVAQWTLARTLYELEKYNGWGYRLYHPHVNSPYLWGFANHYRSGKYVADGTWSDSAVSRQCGAAVIIRRLEERDEIPPLQAELVPAGPLLYYANEVIEHGEALQRFLNTFDGVSLRVDGWPGERTSDVMQRVFGYRLSKDPRD